MYTTREVNGFAISNVIVRQSFRVFELANQQWPLWKSLLLSESESK